MSSKYKSPLIRSRNTSTTLENTSQSTESPSQISNNVLDDKLNMVYDTNPQPSPVAQNWRGHGCSSPRYNSPRPHRGSPFQWSSPNRFNNSWSSDNNSDSYSPYRPPFNKYKKQNYNNYNGRNNEVNDESYCHSSMLEDPWAELLNNLAKKTE